MDWVAFFRARGFAGWAWTSDDVVRAIVSGNVGDVQSYPSGSSLSLTPPQNVGQTSWYSIWNKNFMFVGWMYTGDSIAVRVNGDRLGAPTFKAAKADGTVFAGFGCVC